jgi:hypothetical protein
MAIGRRKLLASGAALWVGPSGHRQGAESSKVHVGHGFAMHGEPRYPEPPTVLDFVNPNAPKGGSVRFGTQGTYDSLHPFILKGVPAAAITQLWETLCWQSRDEAFTVYGLLAETIEVPEDRSWTAFTPAGRSHVARRLADHGGRRDLDLRHAEGQGPADVRVLLRDVLKARRPASARCCSPSATPRIVSCR